MPRARTSACCARRRSCSRRSWRGRSWSVVRRSSKRASSGSVWRSAPARISTSINPEDDPRYRSYVQTYIDVAGRHGVTPDAARTLVRTNATVIAALAVVRGEADAMLCGVEGRYMQPPPAHPRDHRLACRASAISPRLSLMITSKGAFFIADTQVRPNPSAEELADIAAQCRGPCAALRHQAEDRVRVAFRFRQLRHRIRAQDAACRRTVPREPSRRSRPTARCRAIPRLRSGARPGPAAFAPERHRQCADHAES